MIYQERRFTKGADESTSLLGQLLHDREPRRFDVFDIDCVVQKSERRCLRLFEEKLITEEISAAQHRTLWWFATALRLCVAIGLLRDAGVFIVRFPIDRVCDLEPTTPIVVQQVRADAYHTQYGPEMCGTWDTFRPLFTGEMWSPSCANGASS